MGWFSRKPSLQEELIHLMKEDRRVQAELQKQQQETLTAMMNAVTAQTGVIRDYLKMFTEAPKPEVRIMTDVDEIRTEEKIRQQQLADDQQVLAKLPVQVEDWFGQMDDMFKNMKGSI